jgi:hypothetical protein
MASRKTISTILLGLVAMLLAVSLSTASPAEYNVMNFGAKGDGVTDDSAAVNLAITAANKVGGTVYFPAGTYYVHPTGALDAGSGVSLNRFAIPAGTKISGAGINASRILGKLNVGANCTFKDIWLGVDLGSTFVRTKGSTFDFVRFSGGGKYTEGQDWQSTWPWCDCTPLALFGSHLTFNDCIFDGVQGVDTTHTYKFDNVATFGGSHLIFNRCHFEPAAYFSIEMWAGPSDTPYAVHNDFFDCTFDESVAAHIDYALYGASNCTVNNCTFASSGVGPNAHDPGDVTIECGRRAHSITVSNCHMVRGAWCNITIQGAGHDMWITNNTIDNSAGLNAMPMYARGHAIIYAGGDGASHNNHITRNVITSLSGENEWYPAIKVIGNGNHVSRNFIHGWNNTQGTGQNSGTVSVVGAHNTVSGNTSD